MLLNFPKLSGREQVNGEKVNKVNLTSVRLLVLHLSNIHDRLFFQLLNLGSWQEVASMQESDVKKDLDKLSISLFII